MQFLVAMEGASGWYDEDKGKGIWDVTVKPPGKPHIPQYSFL